MPRIPLSVGADLLQPVLSRMGNQGYAPGQHLGSDFPGLYQNVVEDAAGAPVPANCGGVGSVLAAPEVSAADAPQGASNPLFCADRHRHVTSTNSAPAGRNASSVGGVGVGSGGRAAGVFCATEPSAGGPVAQSPSLGNGGGPAAPTRYNRVPRQDTDHPARQRFLVNASSSHAIVRSSAPET